MSFLDLSKPEGLSAFDEYIATKLYIQGYMPTSLDAQVFALLGSAPPAKYTHTARYYEHIKGFDSSSIAQFRAGGPVPDQLAGSVDAPKVLSATPSAPSQPESRSKVVPESSDDTKAARDAQAEKIRKMKADGASKEDVAKEVAILKQIDAQGGAKPEESKKDKKEKGKKEDKKQDAPAAEAKQEEKKETVPEAEANKEEKKSKKDKKEEKKEDKKDDKKKAEPKIAGFEEYDTKLVKAVEKEGGKTGQDIIGVYEMGGLEFFCTTVSTPDGDLKLTELCMKNMNNEIDPSAEERRGGSGVVGKMIFSAGSSQLAVVGYVPEDKQSRVSAVEWTQHVLKALEGTLQPNGTAGLASGVVASDASKNRFAIKMKDEGIAAGVQFLKDRGCFPETKEESGSDMVFGDDDFLID